MPSESTTRRSDARENVSCVRRAVRSRGSGSGHSSSGSVSSQRRPVSDTCTFTLEPRTPHVALGSGSNTPTPRAPHHPGLDRRANVCGESTTPTPRMPPGRAAIPAATLIASLPRHELSSMAVQRPPAVGSMR